MENASKALIIAGAILLSILLISLGIMVYNNAKNTVGSANLNKQEVEVFNSQWDQYVGEKKTASEVRSMIQALIASNAGESKAGTNRWISLTSNGTPNQNTLSSVPNDITVPTLSNSGTYTISAGYSTDGLIVGLSYKKNT